MFRFEIKADYEKVNLISTLRLFQALGKWHIAPGVRI